MKNVKIIGYIFFVIMIIQLIYMNFIPIVKADTEIPLQYYQNLDFSKPYVYNVTQFNDAVGWYNFTPYPGDSYEGDWRTNSGGQIIVNFTGFYNKDPNDWGNVFKDPIPWADIKILENNNGMLVTNFSLSNRSNSEVARALTFGFNKFQSGFLVPNSNLTYLEKLAVNQSDPGGP